MSNITYQTSKPPVFSSHIGTSSILLVFVVLSLVSFAALSIVSANADYLLTKKVDTRAHSYYDAQNQAQNTLKMIEDHLSDIYASVADESTYFSQVESTFNQNAKAYNPTAQSLTYTFPLSDTQWLNLTVKVLYPTDTENVEYYIVDLFRVETNTESLEYNETLPVLKLEE